MAAKPEIPASQRIEKVLATHFDEAFARKAEACSSKLHEWIDLPLSVITFEPNPEAFFGCRTIQQYDISQLPSVSYGRGDQLILDFGAHRVGYFSFHLGVDGVNIDAPARLRLTFGEVPYDVTEDLHPCNSWISTSWLPDETINVDWLPADVSMPRRYSFRYVKIEVIDTSPKYKVRFSDIKARAVSAVSPTIVSSVEPLQTSDEELISLDRISILTLRDCMQTVFEDGPRRDRRLWLGDLRLQALTNYCTFKNHSLVKHCLYLFATLPREDGSLPACIFEKPKLSPATDYIVDYDALFGPTVLDYALASGDMEAAAELWPTILSSMKTPLSHLNSTGRFISDASTAWKFLDWSDGLDTDAGMHGLVLYCCKQINKLANILSIPEPYLDIVEQMGTGAAAFYDSERGVFVSGPNRQFSWISQAWMALSGVMDAATCLRAIEIAMADPEAVKPLTPYAYHHVCEALARCGGQKQCLHLMRRYWGGMARAGADTFWECFDEEDSRKSPYGDCHNNSYCHAWSCTPSYLLRAVLKDDY